MNDHPDDSFDELMRRALHEEADRIEPADGLHAIRSRVRDQHRPAQRKPWMLTAGAAVVGTAAAVGAFAILDDAGRAPGESQVAGPSDTAAATTAPATTDPAPPSEGPTAHGATPTPAATDAPQTYHGKPEASAATAVPVYWVGKTVGIDTPPGVRLYRTFTRINGRPAYEAVRLMTAGRPNDPDYQSLWTGARVGSVTSTADVITVDFEQLPRRTLSPDVAHLASQQLVYTVQAALGESRPVFVTVSGKPAAQLFGVMAKQPLVRAPALDVQAFVWITSPENNAVVRPPFKVTGIAAAYEAQLNWRVVSVRSRSVVAEGPAMTTEAFKHTPYTFTVKDLPAGTYTLEVFETSAEDGRPTSTDTKTFVVK